MSIAAHGTVHYIPHLESPLALSASVASAQLVKNQAEGVIKIPSNAPSSVTSASSAPEAACSVAASSVSVSVAGGCVGHPNDKCRKMFVDSFDQLPISALAVVGPDGLIYDATRYASRNSGSHPKLAHALFACRDESSSSQAYWVDHEDLLVDPITCNEVLTAVVANDGFIYDATTFAHIKQQRCVARGGVVLVSCVPCHPEFGSTRPAQIE
jgi:hypothetical protein